ncbi:MAG TPA: serine/threonine-protein kinase [Ktedonobacteraceae bacterium]|jgi:serine/threonine-protein kinase|nr:serine/threonine-protein kinase [Ktedonobacteraceae bacterium]
MTIAYTPGARIDHYEIVQHLGHGGMSHVFLAKDLQHEGQLVVLKFPNDDMIGNVAVFERYRREAEIGSLLRHPHVQLALNTEEKRSELYLVVEYIKGRTLRGVIEDHEQKPFPPVEVIRLAIQLCDALAYCHEHGVLHRDVKPENIMILEDGSVKIIDFGIALLEGARRVTWRGLSGTVGTPDYMSPEQIKGQRGTASSDIYAVGVILYEMLCGHTPFEGENVFAVMNQHVSQDPPSLLACNATISPELATVVMRAVRRDPEKRYQNMRDMLHDLENLDEVKPVRYVPDKPGAGRLQRDFLYAGVIIIIILLVIIALGFAAQFVNHAAH